MQPSPEDTNRLIELLSRGWDARRTPDEHAELEAFLAKHGAAGCQVMLDACALHVEIERHVAATNGFEQAMARIRESISALQPAAALPSDAPQPRRSSHPLLPAWLAWGMAACLIVAIAYQLTDFRGGADLQQPPHQITRLLRPSQPVANLTRVENAVWSSDSKVSLGASLVENQRLELVSGSAQLSMVCGADLVLQAPCVVTLVADDYATLQHGTLTAQAAKWATGFVVEANELQITDLGTRFAISADGQGVVEAHVLEGEVLAEPMKAQSPRRSSVLLKSGQAIRVDRAHSSIDLIDARKDDFAGAVSEFRPLRPIRIANTGIGGSVGSDDVNWQVVAGGADSGPYPRPAVVTDGDTGSYKDNKPEVSQWISITPIAYPGVQPETVHTFETTFDLTGYDLSTVQIVGNVLVDDAINELRINGKPVDFQRWVATWDKYDFESFHPIQITSGFVPGKNVISIDVFNSPSRPETPRSPNPIGLRIEWQAFGCTLE